LNEAVERDLFISVGGQLHATENALSRSFRTIKLQLLAGFYPDAF